MTDQQHKVVSHYAPANELIAEMRKLAVVVAEIGNAAYDARTEKEDAHREWSEAKNETDEANMTLTAWTDAIEDYRRGILDRDELFARTVGRT